MDEFPFWDLDFGWKWLAYEIAGVVVEELINVLTLLVAMDFSSRAFFIRSLLLTTYFLYAGQPLQFAGWPLSLQLTHRTSKLADPLREHSPGRCFWSHLTHLNSDVQFRAMWPQCWHLLHWISSSFFFGFSHIMDCLNKNFMWDTSPSFFPGTNVTKISPVLILFFVE